MMINFSIGEDVLTRLKASKNGLKIVENRRGSMMGRLMRHDNFRTNLIEEKVADNRGRGRP